MKMFVKGISTKDFSENWVRRWSNRSLWMMIMTVSGSSPTNSTRRIVQYFYRISVVSFREQKAFVLKTGYFLLAFHLGICEGVGEDSGYGIGHVDIRVGS